MVKALSTWLYDGDPLAPVAFEAPLQTLKERIQTEPDFLTGLLKDLFLNNPRRSTVILKPDPALSAQIEAEEQLWLERTAEAMSEAQRREILEQTRRLNQLQQTPDAPEDLARIPALAPEDLERTAPTCPRADAAPAGVPLLRHDLFTGGILYFDIGFDLSVLSEDQLPWMSLLGAVLLESGTRRTGFVDLMRRISTHTGGIHASTLCAAADARDGAATRFFLRSKCMARQTGELLDLLEEILLEPDFSNRERFRQIVLEHKAAMEAAILPSGHQAVTAQLKKAHHPAFYTAEKTGGFSTLHFLRELTKRMEQDFDAIQDTLRQLHRTLIRKSGMILNLTAEAADSEPFIQALEARLSRFPGPAPQPAAPRTLPPIPAAEAFTLPTQVNYVGKAGRLYDTGYVLHGSAWVITRYLQTAWLWEQIRVLGGAYGGMCGMDPRSGVFHFASYRDPNLTRSLEVYDRTADFLKALRPDPDELDRALVGAVGAIDKYQLPDAKGYSDLIHGLIGMDQAERQQRREEMFATRPEDFNRFGEALETALKNGNTALICSPDSARKLRADGMELSVQPLL
jgi:Zn-dependent M16 (insulinase) family peptidase